MTWKREFELARKAVRAAGRILQGIERNELLDSTGRDVKHQGDLEAEKVILEVLEKASVYPILAEESGERGKIDDEIPVWIIDPLDGTLNYSRGINLCCVSIALWQGNRPILGAIYDFNGNELFEGIVEQDAWCNGRPISVSTIKSPQKAVLTTGFPINRDFSKDSIKNFISQISQFKKIRLLGTAALSLAYVAAGRVDAYAEEDIMFWDVAAGIAIVKAAGGFVEFRDSRRKRWAKNVLAGSVFYHELYASKPYM